MRRFLSYLSRTGPYCLTLLSEPTRKVAVFELSKLRNGAPATPKQQGPEGRRRRKKGGEKVPNVTSETHRK